MASVSGSSTQQILQLTLSLMFGTILQKTKNARRLSVNYVLRSSHFIVAQQICVNTSWTGTVAQEWWWEKKEKQGMLHCLQGQSTVLRLEQKKSPIALLAQDMRPKRVVEGQGFIKLMAYLESGYKVPSRKHVTSIIRQKHDLGKKKLQERLSEVIYR